MKVRLVSLVLLLVVLCSGCFGGKDTPSGAGETPSDVYVPETDLANTVTLDGTTYKKRTDIRTVLFLGIDNTKTVEAEGAAVGNQGRADAVVLFVLDKTAKTTTTLLISRNTMTEVDMYKANGDLATSGVMQINMQYAFGNGPARGNFLMKRTVSELLYNTRIDGCISMTLEGISAVVDGMGGITVTMPEDFTDIDERYEKGVTVTLNGEETERFVRYRDIEVSGSAEDRLDRQSWFVHTLFQQLKAEGNLRETLEEMLNAAGEYIETDLDGDTLQMLADYEMLDETEKVPGETRRGELHDEYYVDEEALRSLLVELFYEPVN